MSLCRSQFDALVSVYSDNGVDDGAGGQTFNWVLKSSIWCLIDEATKSELLDRDGLDTQGNIVLFTNYRSNIVVTDRLQLDGGALNITSVKRVDKKRKSSRRGEFLRIDTDDSSWFNV